MRLIARTVVFAILLLGNWLPASAEIAVTQLAEPVSIAGQWKFRLGDDANWSAPDLDDSIWQVTEVPARAPKGHDVYAGMLWYRLTLNLDLSDESVRTNVGALGVKFGNVMSAYELYAGGEIVGRVGGLPPAAEPRYDERQVFAIPASAVGSDGQLVLALRVWRDPRVSEAWETGPYYGDFLVGNVGELQRQRVTKALWPNAFLAAVYLVLGLYHLLIARRNPGLREFFWFGLFSVALAGYTFESSQAKFLVDVPFMWHKKLELLLLYGAPILFGNTLFSVTRTPSNWLLKGFNLVFGLFFLAALLVPGDAVLSYTLRWFQYLAALWALSMAVIMARRASEGSWPARVIVALLLLIIAALFNDYLLESPIIGSGNILYIVFALMLFFIALMMAERYTDILRNLEDSVAQRTSELVQANRELEAAAETKGNFLANMSHEMRTPMNAILGLTRLGLKTELTDRQRDYFGKVEQSAEGLQDIIDSILDFSKLEDGSLECVSEPFSPASLVSGIERTWSETVLEAGLELVIDADTGIPSTLVGDEKRLKQVLGNFVSNAVKFTEKGQVSLALTLLEGSQQSARIRFAVSDTGVGIPEDKRRQLFEAFFQADNTMTRQYGGTGLGLAIAQRLVELMGGSIDVDSTPGAGSTFRFDLELPVSDQPAESTVDAADIDLTPIRGARVLLVDDSELNLQVAGELLRQAKLRVDTAVDGRQALEKVGLAPYDCVLMDVQMPVMDGYAATEHIRAKPHFRDLPVLAMTANAMPQDRARGAEAGINAYIPKPIEPEELYGALLQWITHGERDYDERDSGGSAQVAVGSAELPDSLPGINIQEGLKRVAGNQPLYLTLLNDLCGEYANSAGRLQTMLDDGDSDGASQLAHKLRGIANNLGAEGIGAAAATIEMALKSGEALAPEALPELTAALAQVAQSQASLAPFMSNDEPTALDDAQRQALFEQVLSAVAESSPAALDGIGELLAALSEDTGGYAELTAARDALDVYDFAAAGEHLQSAIQAGHFGGTI